MNVLNLRGLARHRQCMAEAPTPNLLRSLTKYITETHNCGMEEIRIVFTDN
jgi:hypothetical protein